MEKKRVELTISSLLHPIAWALRQYEAAEHLSESDFVSENVKKWIFADWAAAEEDEDIQILRIAAKIAAGKNAAEKLPRPAERYADSALNSIFNIVNRSSDEPERKHCFYPAELLLKPKDNAPIYPQTEKGEAEERKQVLIEGTGKLQAVLPPDAPGKVDLDLLLNTLEENFSYFPAMYQDELNNVSLFDQAKMAAALSSSLAMYLAENLEAKEKLEKDAEIYQEKAFLLYSLDISGIQKFIYMISSKGALKGLRARSFYLEIVMEHIIDELLESLGLSRVNLMYSGGGHCYLVLPNTDTVKARLESFEKEVNQWFLKVFGNALYLGGGYCACSGNDLTDFPQGSYSDLYRQISRQISAKKMHRYTAEDIIGLNQKTHQGDRECSVCRRMDQLMDDDLCSVCSGIKNFSEHIIDPFWRKSGDSPVYLVVQSGAGFAAGERRGWLPLPFDRQLIAQRDYDDSNPETRILRQYVKNRPAADFRAVTKLWVGDYSAEQVFDELAKSAEGVKKIAVFRADVDNLGTTFVSGFRHKDEKQSDANLTRSAALSRQLSLFFKFFINDIMRQRRESWLKKADNPEANERQVSIVYSGGDDVFLVGAWNEVVEAAIDLRQCFRLFNQRSLTLSGGIGLYDRSYPINVMAEEVAELEENAKGFPGKDAISLFDRDNVYHWDNFLEQVMGEKFRDIQNFFDHSEERGKNFLYNMLTLFRNAEEKPETESQDGQGKAKTAQVQEKSGKINIARLFYLLSRLEPGAKAPAADKERYQYFAAKAASWIRDSEERKQAITAMYLYIYLTRETKQEKGA